MEFADITPFTHLEQWAIASRLNDNFEQFCAFFPLTEYNNNHCRHLFDFKDTDSGRQHRFVAYFLMAQHFRMQSGGKVEENWFRDCSAVNSPKAKYHYYKARDEIVPQHGAPVAGVRPGSMLILEKVCREGKCVGWMWYLYTNMQGQPDDGLPPDEDDAAAAPPPAAEELPAARGGDGEEDEDDVPPVLPQPSPRGRKKKRARHFVVPVHQWLQELMRRNKCESLWMGGMLGGTKGVATMTVGRAQGRQQLTLQKVWQDAFFPLCGDPTAMCTAILAVAGLTPTQGREAYTQITQLGKLFCYPQHSNPCPQIRTSRFAGS